jgi:hypothetical protein
MDKRNTRNFGAGKTLNNSTIRVLALRTMKFVKRGSATYNKCVSALHDIAPFLRDNYGIRDISECTQEIYDSYCRDLYMRLLDEDDGLSSSSTSGYVSALNKVFEAHGVGLHARASEFGISRGERFSNENRSIREEDYLAIRNELTRLYKEKFDILYIVMRGLFDMQREMGLRFRESAQMKIINKDFSKNVVSLDEKGDGAKNSRERTFTSVNDLVRTREHQSFIREHKHTFSRGSSIPGDMIYKQFEDWAGYHLTKIVRKLGIVLPDNVKFHGNRHHYALKSYSTKWEKRTGHKVLCSVEIGEFGGDWVTYAADLTGLSREEVFQIDGEIRDQVSDELGHGRIDVVNTYAGGRRKKKQVVL